MNFDFTNEQKMVREAIRKFVENEIAPIAADIDARHEFPMENIKKLGQYGFFAIPFSTEYGGAGGDEISKAIVLEEIGKKCGATSGISSVHYLPTMLVDKYGTKDQKEKYLNKLITAEYIGAFALTEPSAGSDASNVQTTAVLDGDEYVLNGTKCFISNGGVADFYIVLAMTDKSKGIKGISAFIIEKDTPGFSIGKIEDKLGICASATAELIFENCKIPKENLLGKEGRGFILSMVGLDSGRIGMASQALGLAEGAMEETVKYLKEREQFGKPLIKMQGLQWYLAEMETKIEAARGLVYKAAYLKQTGKPYTKEAAIAKLFASEVAMFVTHKAVQMHGGYGFMKEYPVERMMRDAKITEIYEGTSEIMKIVIANQITR
ncbi:acyl-CoA dehydrogenase [Tepidibacter hydrothermalis]|uniref:Acyl-CoA dehydrogenase n=1 Tax=Tepidibacter hydrothermalis TaxID=3036126 RepID=A0ABY8EBN3_9FIRM|nr:acyl-CoA dehydrogenase [Tepidibacter hydrothermalis]WFD10314.1 acyl-CoA dehydrogenase [Tepidibacter hydrothermalis]